MTIDTTTTPNVSRLIELGRWLTKEERERRLGRPSHWNQSVWVDTEADDDTLPIDVAGKPNGQQPVMVAWSCGTAACAAGHIAIEDGGQPAFIYDGEHSPVPPFHLVEDAYDYLDYLSSSRMYFRGRLETIEEHGRRALGLTEGDATRLFDGNNQWEDMVYLIGLFTGIGEDQLPALVGGVDMPADPDEDW